MPPIEWSHLTHLSLEGNMLGTAGLQHLVSCSLLSLELLGLQHTGINGPAMDQWPALQRLSLAGNNITYMLLASHTWYKAVGPCLNT